MSEQNELDKREERNELEERHEREERNERRSELAHAHGTILDVDSHYLHELRVQPTTDLLRVDDAVEHVRSYCQCSHYRIHNAR